MNTEIKIDKSTLPKDGLKVKWQTHKDFNNDNWKEGIFSNEDNFFLIGFENSTKDWDMAIDVLHWKCIECDGTGFNSYPNHDTTYPTCPACRL